MSEELKQHPARLEVWRMMIKENRELKKENTALYEANKRMADELNDRERQKKLWLKRAGWALVFICAWLIWYAHKHPGTTDSDDPPMGWF